MDTSYGVEEANRVKEGDDSQKPGIMFPAYKNTHLWLLVPFLLVLVGFVPSYWAKFFDAPFRHHLHGISATAWFLILVFQPYLITRGSKQKHRFYGLVSLFIAGGVVFSALSVVPFNFSGNMPDVPKYGLTFFDLVMVSGFSVSVFMAVKSVRVVADHAKWMISTVFWSLMPGLLRLMMAVTAILVNGDPRPYAPFLLTVCGLINIVVLASLMYRSRQAHPAYILAAIGSLPLLSIEFIAGMEWWMTVADALFSP
ncbi:hypothetical protein [Biformimicrobium ophioploci]|uniref:Uncharacterized protein n=1 Tax=Biformimicrobium ophioploci TaxID=3036711 RepID=A0ABQ6M333_9GAMM|nr:hypothetical protein [Microbulbifer sp. NKW57]GMG88748.1 hypothetical protein MNKW57_30690 [Microbulbifer sp. NKW57]